MRSLSKLITFSLFTFFAFISFLEAQELPSSHEISSVLAEASEAQDSSERLMILSEQFLGRPYGSVCGDGTCGEFQQGPVSCFSEFDCVTYVEAVLALYFMEPAGGIDEYLDILLDIKYSDEAEPHYENRNHFVSLDWMPNQIAKAYLHDITAEILPNNYSVRRLLISKKNWYESKTDKDIQLQDDLPNSERAERLQAFKELGNTAEDVLAELPYIATDDLLKQEVQDQIPDVSLFNLVRGDHRSLHIPVIVGHQGFLIRLEDGSLVMRHASTSRGVVDVPLNDYLNEVKSWRTWPILGLNIASIATPTQK